MSGWDQEYDLREWGHEVPDDLHSADGIILSVAIGLVFWIGVFIVSRRLFFVMLGLAVAVPLIGAIVFALRRGSLTYRPAPPDVEVAVGYWGCETCGTRVSVEVEAGIPFSPVFSGECHCGRRYEVLPATEK